uniref:Putative ovule protein n=1 Tax=Solanum chacoense TaxID=4108 RepID=A0A0V0I1K1_SOLCH
MLLFEFHQSLKLFGLPFTVQDLGSSALTGNTCKMNKIVKGEGEEDWRWSELGLLQAVMGLICWWFWSGFLAVWRRKNGFGVLVVRWCVGMVVGCCLGSCFAGKYGKWKKFGGSRRSVISGGEGKQRFRSCLILFFPVSLSSF